MSWRCCPLEVDLPEPVLELHAPDVTDFVALDVVQVAVRGLHPHAVAVWAVAALDPVLGPVRQTCQFSGHPAELVSLEVDFGRLVAGFAQAARGGVAVALEAAVGVLDVGRKASDGVRRIPTAWSRTRMSWPWRCPAFGCLGPGAAPLSCVGWHRTVPAAGSSARMSRNWRCAATPDGAVKDTEVLGRALAPPYLGISGPRPTIGPKTSKDLDDIGVHTAAHVA